MAVPPRHLALHWPWERRSSRQRSLWGSSALRSTFRPRANSPGVTRRASNTGGVGPGSRALRFHRRAVVGRRILDRPMSETGRRQKTEGRGALGELAIDQKMSDAIARVIESASRLGVEINVIEAE